MKYGDVIKGERGDIHMVIDYKDSRHFRVLTLVSDQAKVSHVSLTRLPPRWPTGEVSVLDIKWSYQKLDTP